MKKIIYVAVLLMMALTMVSCGGKNDSGGSSSSQFSSNPLEVATVDGFIQVYRYQNMGQYAVFTVTVGAETFQTSPQSSQIISTFLNTANSQGIRPDANGNLSVRITGSRQQTNQYGNQYGTQYGTQTNGVGNILNISQIVSR